MKRRNSKSRSFWKGGISCLYTGIHRTGQLLLRPELLQGNCTSAVPLGDVLGLLRLWRSLPWASLVAPLTRISGHVAIRAWVCNQQVVIDIPSFVATFLRHVHRQREYLWFSLGSREQLRSQNIQGSTNINMNAWVNGMHVRTTDWTNAQMNAWHGWNDINECTHEWMNEGTIVVTWYEWHECMNEWADAWMDGWMDGWRSHS